MRKEILILMILLCCAWLQAQISPTMPAPNRNMTGTGPSPHRPPGEHPETVAGTVEGFVYWDANSINHIPTDSCSGLAITVSVGSSSGGPLTAYTPLGTLSNNFKHLGQVKEFLSGGGINVYDVCTYAYDKVPVGPPLQVKLTVTQPTAFSPVSTPQYEILGPITIINGRCNMLPRIVNPNASDLTGNWGSCQDKAYNVNFAMLHPGALGAGTPRGSGNVRVEPKGALATSPLLKGPGPVGAPMLSGAPQQGMLATGAPATVQSSSTARGAQNPAPAIGSASVMSQQKATPPSGSNPQPNRQSEATRYANAANAATGVKLPSGTITGFVYWQMNVFQPQADCQGLSVKIITVNNSGMPLQLLSTTSNLVASGPMTDYSAIGTPKYMLCSYSFQNIPEKVSVRALLYGMPTTASVAIPSAFQIAGGNCNSTPSSTLSFILTGGPMLCGEGAYNINFKLTASAATTARSPENSTLLRNTTGGPPHGLLAQPPAHIPNVGGPASGASGGATLLSSPGAGLPAPAQGQSETTATRGTATQTLTNVDVANMLKAGLAESVIISSIRSSRKNFDFSPAGCQTLKRARVSVGILAAMGNGSVRPCGEITGNSSSATPGSNVELNPQPLPPRTAAGATPGTTAAGGEGGKRVEPVDPKLTMKLGPAVAGQMMKNSRISERTNQTLAALQKQRSAADIEAAEMKLSLRPAVQASTLNGPLQTMSSGTMSPGVSAAAPAPATLATNRGTATPSPGNISPAITHAPHINTTVVTCTHDPTFRILTVSGNADRATFTPIDKYNLYTITGCSFGSQDAKNTVYIYGTGTFQANFNIKYWSDNSIVLSLDPTVTGYPDLDGVSLVVQRSDGQQTQQGGFKFYAARKTVPLATIPQSWVKFATFTYRFKTMDAVYSSPPAAAPDGPGPSAGTAYVSRFINGQKFDPIGDFDLYDLSKLAPGWTGDSFQISSYDQRCPYVVTYRQTFGAFKGVWDAGGNPVVWLSDTTCSGFLSTMPWVNYQNWTGSYYSVQVWVSGPRGVDPFTNERTP